MIEVHDKTDAFVSEFRRCEKNAAEAGQDWLLAIRREAFARFAELGFPTTRHEEWQNTNVSSLAKTAFEPAADQRAKVSAEQLEPFTFGGVDVGRLVFVDGRYAAELSSLDALPKTITIESLASAIQSGHATLEQHLAQHACCDDQAFTALNTALMEDGAFIHVPKGIIVEQPIHILHVSTAAKTPSATHPRNLIVAESSSQVTIVETYAGLGDGVCLTNTVTEIVALDNAVVNHCKVVREGDQAFHMSTLQLHQYRDTTTSSHAFMMGGSLTRNDINAVMDGEGGHCTLNGLSMLDGTQHVDNHLCVDHAKPHCDSREFFKNVLDGASRGVFSGRINVHKDAQKTDAKQSNMSLLLSDKSQADSKPQLEIFADDVKCTHGATIGQIDKDAIFYLRSRGLNERAAYGMLVYAFARESIAHARPESLRAHLDDLAFSRLPVAQLPREDLS